MNYRTEFQLFLLAVVVILSWLSVYLTRTLKKKETAWEPQWGIKRVRTKYGVKPGILGVALLFAVLHLELVMVPILFVGAVIKLYAYERTHCLYVPVLIHFIYNLVVVLLTSLL